jgi:hypothetical protein
MRESYVEGIATHDGPESCAACREASSEALTGVRAGRVLSREIMLLRDVDAVEVCGKRNRVRRYRETHRGPARSKTPCTHGNTSHENREVCGRLRLMEPRAVSGSPRTHAGDERAQEVGRSRSTAEVSEQCRAPGGGGGGGKRTGQRESASAKRAPDSGPARRAKCAGAGTSGGSQR